MIGSTPAATLDPARDRERAIFREWAKAIREISDASKRLNKKQAQREAWAIRSAKAKEDKLRAHYRLSSYALFIITKRGLAEKWPTEKPEDSAIAKPIVDRRQEYLDSVIFEEELNAWVAAHKPSTVGTVHNTLDFANSLISPSDSTAEWRKLAPINPCMVKLPDGRVCVRKVVGAPGRGCYEHRAIEPQKGTAK